MVLTGSGIIVPKLHKETFDLTEQESAAVFPLFQQAKSLLEARPIPRGVQAQNPCPFAATPHSLALPDSTAWLKFGGPGDPGCS